MPPLNFRDIRIPKGVPTEVREVVMARLAATRKKPYDEALESIRSQIARAGIAKCPIGLYDELYEIVRPYAIAHQQRFRPKRETPQT